MNKMKNTYVVLQFKKDEKYASLAEKIGNGVNVVKFLSKYENLCDCEIVESKKKAEEIAEMHNEIHKKEKRYLEE